MNRWILMLLTVFLGSQLVACASSARPLRAEMPAMAIQQAPVAPLNDNYFKSDKTGNLSEAELKHILEAPVFLEEDTRLGIVPVTTAYDVDEEVPLAVVPHQLSQSLEKTGLFNVTTEVSTDWPADGSVAGLRELAARYRSKYLLLYRHRFVDRSHTNGWAWTYPTIVGIFAAPASTVEIAGVMEATLFDVRSGTILFTAFERVYTEEQLNIWNNDYKRRKIKERLLKQATDKLAKTMNGKVRRLAAANPNHQNKAVAQPKSSAAQFPAAP